MLPQIGRDREKGQLQPIICRPESWVTAFTSPATDPVTQDRKERVRERDEERVWLEKRVRRNEQTKQVVGVTYQVPLFFPSFLAFLEAL